MSDLTKPRCDDADVNTVELSEWHQVLAVFRDLFAGLGEISEDASGVAFYSKPPDVATGLALRRDGRLAASMPLHGVETTVQRIRWDDAKTWIELLGDGVAYTYRIPEELLRHRKR